jgi:hypothetical protein
VLLEIVVVPVWMIVVIVDCVTGRGGIFITRMM